MVQGIDFPFFIAPVDGIETFLKLIVLLPLNLPFEQKSCRHFINFYQMLGCLLIEWVSSIGKSSVFPE